MTRITRDVPIFRDFKTRPTEKPRVTPKALISHDTNLFKINFYSLLFTSLHSVKINKAEFVEREPVYNRIFYDPAEWISHKSKMENCLKTKYFSGLLQFFFTSLNKHGSVKNGIMETVYNRNFLWSCRNVYRTNLHSKTETYLKAIYFLDPSQYFYTFVQMLMVHWNLG